MKTNKIMEAMCLILLSAILSIFLYIILHEFGHTLVLWSVGADISEFSVLSAHVSYDGGAWTNTSDRWMHLNGMLLPVVIAIVYMLLYRKNVTNRFYHVFSAFFVMMPIASLLAWLIIPILYMMGQAPEDDDVFKFLYNFCFDYPPYIVSICAAIVLFCCVYIAQKKGIIKNFRETIKKIKNSTLNSL